MQMTQLGKPFTMSGTCQMCGKKQCPHLFMLYLGEWSGWACPECIEQVANSQERRFSKPMEHTEPGE